VTVDRDQNIDFIYVSEFTTP